MYTLVGQNPMFAATCSTLRGFRQDGTASYLQNQNLPLLVYSTLLNENIKRSGAGTSLIKNTPTMYGFKN
jgi:hypothetical protein